MDDSKIINKDYFGIEFPNGTLFMAKHSKIISVAEQVYWLNGIIIKEISIDFENADTLLRIYSMRLPGPKDMIDKAQNTIPKADGQKMTSVFSSARDRAEKLEEKLNNHTEYSKVIAGANIVSKVYPSTTHAKTIEYAVADEKELDTFHATIIRDISKYDSESKEALDSNPKIGGRLYIFKKDEEKK